MAKPKVQPPVRSQSLITHAVNTGRSEGFPVSLAVLARTEGTVTLGLDMGSAPVPSKRYAADVCDATLCDGDLRLVFAQRSLESGVFESALVIKLNPMAAQQFIGSLAEMNGPTVQEIARRVGETVRPLERVAVAKQMVSVVANFVTVAVAGFEACLDFYHASAFAMRAVDAQTKSQLELEPVVRVDLRTGALMAVTDELGRLESQLPRPSTSNTEA